MADKRKIQTELGALGMVTITTPRQHQIILTDEHQDANLLVDLFEPDYLASQELIVSEAQGRGTAYIFDWQGQRYVLRHYHRGGLIAKFNRDHYLWTGLHNTRAYREFSLLLKMQTWQLATSRALAARIIRSRLSYQADIITHYVPHDSTLAQRLKNKEACPWENIGQAIGKMHAHHIHHDDLNSHNILINGQDDITIIDFDKGAICNNKQKLLGNIERLKRSVEKEGGVEDGDWAMLLEGYRGVGS